MIQDRTRVCVSVRAPARFRRILNQPGSFVTKSFDNLNEFILSVFPKEDGLKEESILYFWKNIFIAAVKSIEKPDKGQGAAQDT